MKLTDHGRRQAFLLSQVYEPNMDLFQSVYSSDLQRCIDTAYYTMGFPTKENAFMESKLLREMNFGETEGLHYDGLSQEQKDEINSPDYHAPQGESYVQVKERMHSMFRDLLSENKGPNSLIFTHGVPLTICLQEHGVKEMPTNGSMVGVVLDQKNKGEIKELEFVWEFPIVTDDI